ncbi:hypothetical protein [Emticicia sp. 17c]|uniref:hypothetical protein n=1 Tax=Emticicia sp. 17c TaxID=3127704 RepID=UPI00301BC250
MQSEQSQEVTKRFFEILDELVQLGHIHFMNDFYVEHKINSRNIYQLRKDYSRDIMQLEWLTALVRDYHVSGDYLLTGKGKKYRKELEPIERPKRRKYQKHKTASVASV